MAITMKRYAESEMAYRAIHFLRAIRVLRYSVRRQVFYWRWER